MANRDSLPPVPPYDDDEDASNGFHQNDFHHNDYDRASPDEPAPAPGLGPVSPVASHHAYDATAAAAQRPLAEVAPAVAKAVDEVLSSDIGISTLLSRLKQSVAAARELASFMSGVAKAEELMSRDLLRHSQTTVHNIQRGESRQGSYSVQLEHVANLYKQMSTVDMKFVYSLNTMSQDLMNLAGEKDKERKHWKQMGLSAEDKARDAERQLDKAKTRYDSLASEYDLVKTGDKSAGRFGIRSMGKSSDQREEDLYRRVKNADEDYQLKVSFAQQVRSELLSSTRPEAVNALQLLIHEVDGAVTMQLQKLAGITEQNFVRNGMLLNPIPDLQPGQRGFRQIVSEIDNDQDYRNYVVGFSARIPPRPSEIVYQQHPTMRSAGQQAPQMPPQSMPPQSMPPQTMPPQSMFPPQAQQPPSYGSAPAQFPMAQQAPPPQQAQIQQQPPHVPQQDFQRFGGGALNSQPPGQFATPPRPQQQQPPYPEDRYAGGQPPMYPSQQPPPGPQYVPGPQGGPMEPPRPQQAQPPHPSSREGAIGGQPPAPSGRRMFGVTLDDLFERDQSPVPLVVIQCIQAVDMFGLETEGIYRVSGNQAHIQQLKARFDQDAYTVDFRNPEHFYHDVHVPANLLKLFLRELPEPLLTSDRYNDFINAGRIDDEIVRRDSLHAIINDLPDANYATLRAVILHLFRINENAASNRMTPQNLAVIFGPTIMGPHAGEMALAGLQPKVISTILSSAMEIFDED